MISYLLALPRSQGSTSPEQRDPVRGLHACGLELIPVLDARYTSPRLVSNIPMGGETRVLQGY